MRRFISVLLSLSLILICVACSEESDANPYPNIKRITILSSGDNEGFIYEFKYFNDEISSIVHSYKQGDANPIMGTLTTYKKEGNNVIIETTSPNGHYGYNDTLIINKSLCVKECFNEWWYTYTNDYDLINDKLTRVDDLAINEYSYSNRNELLGVKGPYMNAAFIWDNGNVKEAYYKTPWGQLISTQFSYYDDKNPFNAQPLDIIMSVFQYNEIMAYGSGVCLTTILKQFGKRNKNLIKAVSSNDSYGSENYNIQYCENDEHLINGIIITSTTEGIINVSIEY